eukprot:TRINITY_DN1883_c0_g2_i1.p1 TRINITY_DN1883_c0_g2~~TRINITY_DN1883_c0_g2_i1.p1  ORF type:complete len:1027 (-),score=356.92 TRINITY_DN1883_c0_g2_i1:12-3092(-)
MADLPAVRVVVATRPLLKHEKNADPPKENALRYKSTTSFAVLEDYGTEDEKERQATFDRVVWNVDDTNGGDIVDQKGMYEIVCQPLMERAFTEGFSFTVFAYGQSGSGKTYTMTGDRTSETQKGLMPRVFENVFVRCREVDSFGFEPKTFSVEMSMIDVYLGKAYDLMTGSDREELDISMYKQNGRRIVSFKRRSDKKIPIRKVAGQNSDQLNDLYNQFIGYRIIRATGLNPESSRSHSIVRLDVQLKKESTGGVKKKRDLKFSITMVDLAGSERFSKTGAKNDKVMEEEGKSINLSLTILNQVIEALAYNSGEPKKPKIVPYNNHPLTKVLSDSLGGNSYTTMIAAINPCHTNVEETISTINYANNVKKMKNVIKSSLKEEFGVVSKEEIEAQAKLMEQQRIEMEKLRRELQEALEKQGVAIEPLDKSIRHLKNLTPDAMRSGNLNFKLKDGLNMIGNDFGDATIKVNGVGIIEQHCSIECLEDNNIYLTCHGKTMINMRVLERGERVQLKNNDFFVIADCKFFSVNDPHSTGENTEEPTFEEVNQKIQQEATAGLRKQMEEEMQREIALRQKELEKQYDQKLDLLEKQLNNVDDDILLSELNEEKIKLMREKAIREKEAETRAEIAKMTKQRIQEDLINIMPKLKELNAISMTLGKNLEVQPEIKAIPDNVGGFESVVYVAAKNTQTGEEDIWTLGEFDDRYHRVRYAFDCKLKNKEIVDDKGDPFENIEDNEKLFTLGYAHLSLQPLTLPISSPVETKFAVDDVRIPSVATGSFNISPVENGEVVEMPDDPDWLALGNTVEFAVQIESVDNIPSVFEYGNRLQYKFFVHEPIVVNTDQLPHEMRFIEVVTDELLNYLNKNSVIVRLTGHKESWLKSKEDKEAKIAIEEREAEAEADLVDSITNDSTPSGPEPLITHSDPLTPRNEQKENKIEIVQDNQVEVVRIDNNVSRNDDNVSNERNTSETKIKEKSWKDGLTPQEIDVLSKNMVLETLENTSLEGKRAQAKIFIQQQESQQSGGCCFVM